MCGSARRRKPRTGHRNAGWGGRRARRDCAAAPLCGAPLGPLPMRSVAANRQRPTARTRGCRTPDLLVRRGALFLGVCFKSTSWMARPHPTSRRGSPSHAEWEFHPTRVTAPIPFSRDRARFAPQRLVRLRHPGLRLRPRVLRHLWSRLPGRLLLQGSRALPVVHDPAHGRGGRPPRRARVPAGAGSSVGGDFSQAAAVLPAP
jgi:hypothetical protein